MGDVTVEVHSGVIEKVIDQIKEDVRDGDLSAIEELLESLPEEALSNYLPEVERK